MVSVEKYIAPPTTIGPDWSAATSGRLYVQSWASCATLAGVMSVSGEKRSPASVRLYDGQSSAAIPETGDGGDADPWHAPMSRSEVRATAAVIRIEHLSRGLRWTRCGSRSTFARVPPQ